MGEKQRVYSEEVKREAIEMKLSNMYMNRQIMEELGIRHKSRIKTWMKWHREGQDHRLAQPIGKQYSFRKGSEDLTEVEQLKRQIKHLEIKNAFLK